ncbi:MAG: hypothetical protein AAF493_08665, partial [Pseudomonadota bacterium]
MKELDIVFERFLAHGFDALPHDGRVALGRPPALALDQSVLHDPRSNQIYPGQVVRVV